MRYAKCAEQLKRNDGPWNARKRSSDSMTRSISTDLSEKQQVLIVNPGPVSFQNKNGRLMVTIEEKLKRWKNYVEILFDYDKAPSTTVDHGDQMEDGPSPITKGGVVHAIKRQSNGKPEIHSEVLKIMTEKNGAGPELLTQVSTSTNGSSRISHE